MKDKILIILSSLQTLALLAILWFLLYHNGYLDRPVEEYIIKEKPVTMTGDDTIKLTADDPVWGSNFAPITLVAYVDFECPYCMDLYQNIKALESEFITTGKVKVILRDLPLSIHSHSKILAVTAECARRNGHFWDFTDLVFSSYEPFSRELLDSWAAQAGIDVTECLSNEAAINTVRKDVENASDRGLKGTPALFINNTYYRGTKSVEDLRKLFQNQKVAQDSGDSCAE
ncbi:MAG: thioredoxin domain-containing protein [Bacteroidales bacterium]|nr:thioredoxin domain-containing protein [Bacteroidales bacterium]